MGVQPTNPASKTLRCAHAQMNACTNMSICFPANQKIRYTHGHKSTVLTSIIRGGITHTSVSFLNLTIMNREGGIPSFSVCSCNRITRVHSLNRGKFNANTRIEDFPLGNSYISEGKFYYIAFLPVGNYTTK